jgi:methyltransferase (TIGR00027 family)
MTLIQSISDTARWAAVYRARETDRPDAVFRDPFARRLAGERGEEIANAIEFSNQNTWSWIARTYVFDHFITQEIAGGCDLVINLAAGLDARPYRMNLPASLEWIEIDLPGILDYKEDILRDDKPVCALERIRLDLSEVSARRELFARLAGRGSKALIITEGLIVYFTAGEVGALAQALAEPPIFQRWLTDLCSPGLLKLLKQKMGSQMGDSAVLKFAPAEGPNFFAGYGWKPLEVRSVLKTAGQLKRLPLFLKIMSLLPESNGAQGSRPWAAACLMSRHPGPDEKPPA